ncbi:MAG TPA: polymer-forming cytoskeletal protein [Burkholderiaceae bacterium]|jgi:cytoskeletal protein CcmA (bactofilin family)
MLRSETLFGKREGGLPQPGTPGAPTQPGQARPASPLGQGPTLAQSLAESAKSAPGAQPAAAKAPDDTSTGSKLIVGPNIKLKGVEITDCDTIVVEGLVEATIYSRVIQISEQGAFKGAAEIDIAEIRGEFDGELTVSQKLVIFSTGKVSGKIRYGKLVIEEGGQLSGDVQMDQAGRTKGPVLAKTD